MFRARCYGRGRGRGSYGRRVRGKGLEVGLLGTASPSEDATAAHLARGEG